MTLDGTTWGIGDAAAIVAEIDRDLAERAAAYPEQVRKGRLSQTEADYLTGLLGDIREDLDFAFAVIGPGEIRETWERPSPRVTWHNKVRWIRGELEARERRLPDLVAKGRLTAADAEKRIAAIEQLRRLYWCKLFQWRPPEGPALDYLKALRSTARSGARVDELRSSEGAGIYREFVRRHMATVELEEQKQPELAG